MLIEIFRNTGAGIFRLFFNICIIYLLSASIYKVILSEKREFDFCEKVFSNNNIYLALIFIYLSMIGYYWDQHGSEVALTFTTAVGTISGPIVAYLIFIKYLKVRKKAEEEKVIQNWYKRLILQLKELNPNRFNPKFFETTRSRLKAPKYLEKSSEDFSANEVTKFEHYAKPGQKPQDIQKEVKEKINNIYADLEEVIKDAPEGVDYKIYSLLFSIIDRDIDKIDTFSRGYCETIYDLWIKLHENVKYKERNI